MTFDRNHRSRLWEFLEHGLLSELGVPALIVSLVLFTSAMVLLGANLSELRTGYARLQRSNEALVQLAMVNTDILRVEMTARGYVLSGDPAYLVWLKMARDGVHQRLGTLDAVFSDDEDQRGDARMLRRLVDAQNDYFESLTRRMAGEREAVIAEIVDYSKKVKRRPIENLLTDLRGDELREIAVRQVEAERRVVGAYRYAIGISSLALIFGALGFALILHDRRTRRR